MHLWFYDDARDIRDRLRRYTGERERMEMAEETDAWLSGDWRCCVCRCPCLACEDADGHPFDDDAWEWMAERQPVTFTLVDHLRW